MLGDRELGEEVPNAQAALFSLGFKEVCRLAIELDGAQFWSDGDSLSVGSSIVEE